MDYNVPARQATQTLANGVLTTGTANPLGELIDEITKKTASGPTLCDFGGMVHDGAGNLKQFAASLASPAPASYSGTTSYGYDTKDQLLAETSTRVTGSPSFAYDLGVTTGAGNPTTFRTTSGYTFNGDNQYSGSGFQYDGEGNPTLYRGNNLYYDAEDRLTDFRNSGNVSLLTCGYTGDSLRAWKQPAPGLRTYFLYDGPTPVCEMDGTGNVTAVDTFGPFGLLSRRVGATSTFYTFDHLGNPAQRTDSTGTVLASSAFDSYGARVSTDASADPYSYFGGSAGYYTDAETGLSLLGFRYYDTATGRFLTRDPSGYGGGINLYNYCGNNPVNGMDPMGFAGVSIPFPTGAGLGAGEGAATTASSPVSWALAGLYATVDLGLYIHSGGKHTGILTGTGDRLGTWLEARSKNRFCVARG